MPRTARPSGACQNCKNHHVKCDEARPACRRCVRTKRVCPGYPEGLDLVLRDQNQAARAVVDRRRNALSKRTTASVDGSQTSQSQSPPSLTIPCGLVESEDTQARCFLIANFVLFTRDSQADCSFLELLPTLFESLRVDCAVSLALTAVSRCMFGALVRKNRDTETADVRAAFIHAVAATRTAIEDPAEALSDATLMAVCLLGFYEAARDAFRSKLSSARHFHGAAALIENRKISNMNSELAKKIVLAVRNGIVTRAISHCDSIDTSSEVWQDFEQLPQNPATLLDDMSVEVANVLGTASRTPQRIADVEEVETGPPSPTSGPLVRAIAAEARLASWPRAVPRNWIPIRIYRRHIHQEVIDAGLYSDYCEIFPDVVICSTWNSWRRIRLKNLSRIAQLDPESSGIQTVATMQQLADDICATIPFSLGSRTEITPFYDGAAIYPSIKGKSLPTDHARAAVAVGGWSLWSPLKEIINVHMYLRPGQREWVREQLFRLAKIYDVIPQ
ncbi:MAG: hypothetical protein M1835_000389 [Candelina submexicana]|nr:MAG: hypothetical protein M1835_000389 [Candelina submexicana]